MTRAELADTGCSRDGPAGSTWSSCRAARRVRVPPGVTVFDAASWNGIAIDSTCGGHGTCKKCKVRIADGAVAADPAWTRGRSRPTSCAAAGGWPAGPQADADLQVEVPPLITRPKAATVGVGRQVILRPAVQKRYLELAEPTLADQRTDLERVLDAHRRPGAAGRPGRAARRSAGCCARPTTRSPRWSSTTC